MGSYGSFTQNDASAVSKNIKTYTETTGTPQVQVVRGHRASALTTDAWSIVTTAATPRLSADATRTGVTITNIGGSRVYIRWDSTAPTAALYHFYLDNGDRYEVPEDLVELAMSVLGAAAGGTLVSSVRTAA
jgi:hypothetical protein